MQSDDVSVRYTIFGGILTQLQFIPEVASGVTGVTGATGVTGVTRVTGVTSQLGSISTQAFSFGHPSIYFYIACPSGTGLLRIEWCDWWGKCNGVTGAANDARSKVGDGWA